MCSRLHIEIASDLAIPPPMAPYKAIITTLRHIEHLEYMQI